MNPIIEEWFQELDEGDEDLRNFIRQVSDAVCSELKPPIGLIEYLDERGLAVVPVSRLWWLNPRSKMFNPVRTRLTPPGREDAEPELGDVDSEDVAEIEVSHLGAAFLGGALEGIALGQRVSFKTAPAGPSQQQDIGTGTVIVVENARVGVVDDLGRDYWIDLDQGGKIQLLR